MSSKEFSKSAKTVMKKHFIRQPKVVDFTTDPLSLGIRPSTAIQLK